jgi:hypothetical protein
MLTDCVIVTAPYDASAGDVGLEAFHDGEGGFQFVVRRHGDHFGNLGNMTPHRS